MRGLWTREPALVVAVIVAVLNLVVAYGVMEASQADAITTLAETVLILVAGTVVRGQVTPVRDPRLDDRVTR
jgi:hypothetical protein